MTPATTAGLLITGHCGVARITALYQGMAAAWREVLAGYDEEQLEVITSLFRRMREVSRREAARLS